MSYSFDAIEGRYQSCYSEPCGLEKQLQMSQLNVGNLAVRLSFLDIPTNDESSGNFSSDPMSESLFCINTGNDLRIYSHDHVNPPSDRRFCSSSPAQFRFKAPPTSHCFRHITDRAHDSQLLIGLSNGEIKIIDPLKEDLNKVFNEAKSIDESPVTCVSWVPHSPHQFLVSHSSGCMYLYDETLTPISTPTYSIFKQGIGFSVYTCKTKSTRNPLYRWVLGSHIKGMNNSTKPVPVISSPNYQVNGYTPSRHDDSSDSDISNNFSHLVLNTIRAEINVSINHFAFSPCGRFLAVATEDGYLRVIEYHEMELYGFMRSYFGGLLCVDWSPDSLYIVTGGQDDLITVWSVLERAVICRGQGHKSWVSMVRFDPFLCPTTEVTTNTTASYPESLTNNKEELSDSPQMVAKNPLKNYRLGSVGHDTILCLWDLTSDVICEGVKFIRSIISNLPYELNDVRDDCLNLDLPVSNVLKPFCNSSNNIPCNSAPQSSLDNDSTNSSNISSPRITKKRNSHKSVDNRLLHKQKPNNNNSLLSTSSTLSNNGGIAAVAEKAKFIFTLPRNFHWFHSNSNKCNNNNGNNNNNNNNDNNNINNNNIRLTRFATVSDRPNEFMHKSWHSSSIGRLSEVKWMLNVTGNNILGSPLCPRINDVPVLEPLVCNRILKDRVTDLVFRRDTVHIVDQQGLFLAWQRPNELLKDCRSIDTAHCDNNDRLNDWNLTSLTTRSF